MDTPSPPGIFSTFITSHLPQFLDHFGINYCIDGPQIEYFVFQKITGADISCSVTINLDETAGQINVMTFYPGLLLHPKTRYFSAVCFFMILNHFANFHHIVNGCRISLNTRPEVFEHFYSLLKDFDFHVLLIGKGGQIAIESCFFPLGVDTSMLIERAIVL
ncbi:hypothetical protein UWK_02865 [Desulfocapsa sulfexigens DSM 10523]|uniref:Uncharacterized protein n=1 Tax=Desulfocapsa sulfexigens (strain DSM 10523 / SB164P1) TaxID=1167006 RepID=M1PSV1_DESSD|nr:hypothetical protein [Desulfocapsa sulfexigens]AGF79396.1 hypothetical protein UWK_02865 [Desulfocapsa sulfexigens DSM 10523]